MACNALAYIFAAALDAPRSGPDPAEIGPKQPSLRYIFAALLEAPRVVAAPVGGRHTGGI